MSSVTAYHSDVTAPHSNIHHLDDGELSQISCNTEERLAAVQSILNCNRDGNQCIASIVDLLCSIFAVPSACVSLVTRDCVLLKQSSGGVDEGCSYDPPGFCFWTLVPETPQALVIEDTHEDARTSLSPLVRKTPYLRYYAAAPLVTSSGMRVGTLCVLDTTPHPTSNEDILILCNFAELVMRQLEGQVLLREPDNAIFLKQLRDTQALSQAFAIVDLSQSQWPIMSAAPAFAQLLGGQVLDGSTGFATLFLQADQKVQAASENLVAGSTDTFKIDALVPKGRDYRMTAFFLNASAREIEAKTLLVGNPPRPSAESRPADEARALFIVTLALEQMPRRQRSACPFPDLRLLSPLGAGSFSTVYRGLRSKFRVAVKVVHNLTSSLIVDDKPLECQALEAVSHPNIVKLYDWKQAVNSRGQQRLWLILEFCDGGSLADAIDKGVFRTLPRQDAPLCVAKVLHTARDLASGLAKLHAAGFLHCDISGGNILLQSCSKEPYGFRVKLCDFGLARPPSHPILDSEYGTYSYQAPEVMTHRTVSQASDVYSFGVILYEILTGGRAWSNLHPSQIHYAVTVKKQQLPWPQHVPDFLKALAERCLSQEVSSRPGFEEVERMTQKEMDKS